MHWWIVSGGSFLNLVEMYRGHDILAIASSHDSNKVTFLYRFLFDQVRVLKSSWKIQALSRFTRLNIDASHEKDTICSLDGQWVAQVLTLTES